MIALPSTVTVERASALALDNLTVQVYTKAKILSMSVMTMSLPICRALPTLMGLPWADQYTIGLRDASLGQRMVRVVPVYTVASLPTVISAFFVLGPKLNSPSAFRIVGWYRAG